MNIICVLAGGVGNRFGSALPKQYHLINGRPVLSYVLDAAIKSKADEIIVVCEESRIRETTKSFGVTAIEGGITRNHSIGNALKYISSNMECEKIMLIDGVCPLIRSDLIDSYFDDLTDHDAVFTTFEISTGLARKDKEPVNRDDYMLLGSPDAYRFDVLKNCFDPDSEANSPLQLLPKESSVCYRYDFSDYIKIVYPHDLAAAGALIEERERRLHFNSHSSESVLQLLSRLREIDRKGTRDWERILDSFIEFLFNKWGIISFQISDDIHTALSLECRSSLYGDVVLKLYPPFMRERFVRECYILHTLKDYPQAMLLDSDCDRFAILTRRVIPGDYVTYDKDREAIRDLFCSIADASMLFDEACYPPSEIKSIVNQLAEEAKTASKCSYHPEMIKYLCAQASEMYAKEFADEKRYLIHGNICRGNILKSSDRIVLIDPVGYNDSRVFEFIPFVTSELYAIKDGENLLDRYRELIDLIPENYSKTVLHVACFIYLVKQLVPSIYEAADGFIKAERYMSIIKELFLDEDNSIVLEKYKL